MTATPEAETRPIAAYRETKRASAAALPWVWAVALLIIAFATLDTAHRIENALLVAMERQQRYIVDSAEIRREVSRNREDIDRLAERYAPRPGTPRPKPEH